MPFLKFNLKRLPAKGTNVGLFAGEGDLPLQVARRLLDLGYGLTIYAVSPSQARVKALEAFSKDVVIGPLSDARRGLEDLKKKKIGYLTLVGKLSKNKIYTEALNGDNLVKDTFMQTGNGKGDHRLLKTLSGILKLNGIQVLGLADLLQSELATSGNMNGVDVPVSVRKDLKFGYQIAKTMGRMDIGQAVVVCRESVVAVEAMEGTNRMIENAGSLGIAGAVMVKAAKPQQDLRFDLPVIGPDTLALAKTAGLIALGLEAGRCLIMNREATLKQAKAMGIAMVGLS